MTILTLLKIMSGNVFTVMTIDQMADYHINKINVGNGATLHEHHIGRGGCCVYLSQRQHVLTPGASHYRNLIDIRKYYTPVHRPQWAIS